MNELYQESMAAAVDRLYDEQDSVTGVVVTSAKKTFFAGGDLKRMVQTTKDDAAEVFAMAEGVKAGLRRLELFPRPVVAAINGAALGGGYEITLACNHRILVDDPKVEIGMPEASLGLLPGGGGVTRTVRMLGIQSALMDVLLQGTRFKPAVAHEKGLVDELVATREELVPAAKAWIKANPEAEPEPMGRRRLQDAGRHPKPPQARRSSSRPSRRCCASRPREPSTPPSGRSSPPRSRAPRSTSTPPRGSSRATSPS